MSLLLFPRIGIQENFLTEQKSLNQVLIDDFLIESQYIYTAFHKNIPAGISGCRKKHSYNGTFF